MVVKFVQNKKKGKGVTLAVEFRSKIYNWMTTGVANIHHPEVYDGWPSEDNNMEELKLIPL